METINQFLLKTTKLSKLFEQIFMYRNQQTQLRPSSASSSFKNPHFQSNAVSRTIFTPHTSGTKFFQNSSKPPHPELPQNRIKTQINLSSISPSRKVPEKQMLYFRYLNRQEQKNKIIQTDNVRNQNEANIFFLNSQFQSLYSNWTQLYNEFQSTQNETRLKTMQKPIDSNNHELMKKIQRNFEQLQTGCNLKESSQQQKKDSQNKENIEEKQKINEQYIQQLQNQNINLCTEINQLKVRFQRTEEREKQFQNLLQIKNNQNEEVAMKIELELQNKEKERQIKTKLQKQIFVLNEQIGELITNNINAENQNNHLVEKVRNLEEESVTLKQDINEYIGMQEQLMKEMKMCEGQVARLKQQNQKMIQLYNEKINQIEVMKSVELFKSSCSEMERFHQEYENKISQLTQIAKDKEEKIKTLKDTVSKQEKKISEIGDNYISQKQLQTLHKKIENYENALLTQGGIIYDKLTNQTHDYFNGKVFEDQIIYQLKKDNKKLINFISSTDEAHKYFGRSLDKKLIRESSSSSEALEQTYILLEDVLYKLNQIIQTADQSKEDTPKKHSPKGKKTKANSQLLVLKIYIIQVSKYCSNALKYMREKSNSQMKQERRRNEKEERNKKQKIKLQAQRQAQINFYKQENIKLEERINSLLNLNSKLKEQLTKKTPQKKVNNEEYWKNQVQLLEAKVINIEVKLKKVIDEKNQLEKKLLQEQNKSTILNTEIQRLRHQLQRNDIQIQKRNEDIINSHLTKIQQLGAQKQALEKQLKKWGKMYQDSEWKLNNLLEEIGKVSERNRNLEIKLKQTQLLFKKINQLQIKLIELNHGYNNASEFCYSYITIFIYEQLCSNVQRIIQAADHEQFHHMLVIQQIKHNAELCLRILNSIKPTQSIPRDKAKNVDLREWVESILKELSSLVEQLGTSNERDLQIQECMRGQMSKYFQILSQMG